MVPTRQREGEAIGEDFPCRVDRTISVTGRLGPAGISQVTISDMEQDALFGVRFEFLNAKR